MGQTSYPCPACFQAQRVEHQNGEEVKAALCASCTEEAGQAGLSEADYIKARKKLETRKAEARR